MRAYAIVTAAAILSACAAIQPAPAEPIEGFGVICHKGQPIGLVVQTADSRRYTIDLAEVKCGGVELRGEHAGMVL